AAGLLAGLTRSGVVIATPDHRVMGTTLESVRTAVLLDAAQQSVLDSVPTAVTTRLGRFFAVAAPLSGQGTVMFTRSMDEELAVLPELRRVAGIAAAGALLVALLLGAMLASRVARPVRELATAASAVALERFTAPLPASRIGEVSRVSSAFEVMRQALAARLVELREANEMLSDRNARLIALQADLMQRDRLAATGRLVTQLAHEIRNPVASLRNCLELIRRRVSDDQEALEFTDLAIDELLRMHELAEQMLDLNRPRGSGVATCVPLLVASEVARLSNLGTDLALCRISTHGDATLQAMIAPDALKQVLLNVVHNAREALASVPRPPGGGTVDVTVERLMESAVIVITDNGPGIDDKIAPRLFDPFFTTKDAVHGVGLGLFVAEGLVRSAGGRIQGGNRELGGAYFRIELPVGDGASLTTQGAALPEVAR
ncbi:MAG: ATP-binding protein, partial [bacterium]